MILMRLHGVDWARLLGHGHKVFDNTLLWQVSHICVWGLYADDGLVESATDVVPAQTFDAFENLSPTVFLEVRRRHNLYRLGEW